MLHGATTTTTTTTTTTSPFSPLELSLYHAQLSRTVQYSTVRTFVEVSDLPSLLKSGGQTFSPGILAVDRHNVSFQQPAEAILRLRTVVVGGLAPFHTDIQIKPTECLSYVVQIFFTSSNCPSSCGMLDTEYWISCASGPGK